MDKYFEQYLRKNNFKKYFKSLIHKLKNKSVIIYGTGILFQYIAKNYDLSQFNIIGISDMKYSDEMEEKFDLGYKIIPMNKIIDYNPDFVLLSVEKYFTLIESMQNDKFRNTNIQVLPLVKKNLLDVINTIWKRGK